MELAPLLDLIGEDGGAALAGLLVGLVFGVAAQRSRFCLRAATVEFARGEIGPRTSVWLLTFGAALFWVQALGQIGWLDLSEARMLAVPGSISGAVVGGLMFGAGMVMARGCSGRLLVLAATGNLRALLSGLVFAVAAQATLRGILAPWRESVAGLWTTGATNIDLTQWLGIGKTGGFLFGILCVVVALFFAWRNRVGFETLAMASGVGIAIPLGWLATYQLSLISFEPTQIESITFSGPSADTLMFFLMPAGELDFDVGLVPGAFLGACLSALATKEWQLQGFEGAASMRRYLVGAALMGVGAMLAGGCAIGAGVTGASAFALTAWIALTAMWAGAMATDALLDRGLWRVKLAA